jgi:hypothetical protein
MNGKTVSGAITTLVKLEGGALSVKNGAFKNVHEAATETKYSIYMCGSAKADFKDVAIETTGIGIYMTENAHITELNANVESYITVSGYCTFDAVCMLGSAKIDLISGGTYKSRYAQSIIDQMYIYVSGIIESHTLRLDSSTASVGEINGGEFLGIMPKSDTGATVYVNSGKIEKISGGYFGFNEQGQQGQYPDRLMYVNISNGGSIGTVTGGKFVKGDYSTGFGRGDGFISAIPSEYELVATGETKVVETYMSSGTKYTTLTVVELKLKNS